ncbi:MAG: hypothetical protein OXI01_04500 [Albidovulum sp.]|nr:hypothetical protein [Albidovulum sp.]
MLLPDRISGNQGFGRECQMNHKSAIFKDGRICYHFIATASRAGFSQPNKPVNKIQFRPSKGAVPFRRLLLKENASGIKEMKKGICLYSHELFG